MSPKYQCDLCHRRVARAHSAKKYNVCARCMRIARKNRG